ncbi:tubby C-terminal-like domain-containing protein [Lineolata rhizophorae]|uniref:Tubby C-terminal-like domain-containing protein n=1 Tax=Lineolata rhizophorae TaxID=578093 RepID=A0A6A6NVU6_9PEZI|nr:tubby C-terminal-like domain-containing protein [Lineolata rhizophorae]
MALVQLPPVPQPIGVFPQFTAQRTETLILKEKVMSLSGDSFDIKTVDGRPIFKVKGDAFSLSGRKAVSDMQDNHLFDIRQRHLTMHSTYYCEDPSGNEFFEVKNKIRFLSSKAVATFISAGTGKQESLLMKGNFFDSRAEIVDESTGNLVAVIDRKFMNASELLFSQQTYALTVAPGVDMALMVAMCIALDEHRNEG